MILLRWGASLAALVAAILLIAGQWTDPWLWAYCLALAGMLATARFSISAELWRERSRPPEPGADRQALRVIRIVALGHVIVGALDAGRWHVAPVAPELRAAGLVGMIAFAPLIVAAMRANRFFSAVVRVQRDRGHHVVGSGPYAIVRHPGYLGMLGVVLFSALLLGSWLGVALAAVYAALLLRRVTFEDAFLQANLEGYRDYANRVPYRLIPLTW
jgi:protein-S-isoprenylcysteine O-methyltransferase Ste14